MKSQFLFVATLAIITEIAFSNGIEDEIQHKLKVLRHKRQAKQVNADQMVQNILQWLQGAYTQNSRKIRQGSLREYLPPSNTQKPRPFEPPAGTNNNNEEYYPGYPPAGSITPEPPFTIYTNPTTGGVTGTGGGTRPTYIPPSSYQPPTGSTPGFPTAPPVTYIPSTNGVTPTYIPPYQTGSTPGFPTSPTSPPVTYYPSPTPTNGYPTQTTGTDNETPRPSTYQPSSEQPGTQPPSSPSPTPYETPSPPPFTGYPSGRPTDQTEQPNGGTTLPTTTTTSSGSSPTPDTSDVTGYPSVKPTQQPNDGSDGSTTTQVIDRSTDGTAGTPTPDDSSASPKPTDDNVIPSEGSTPSPSVPDATPPEVPSSEQPPSTGGDDEDLKHPPHIHNIDVQCAKDMMTIEIEFNRVFNGLIYSKGHYTEPECRYVNQNSEQTKYKFTVSLNTCGTEFVSAFDTQGKSYLENVLVVQNEDGVQEVWDVVRSVRCLWEGNLKESLSVALSVGALTQEIVTFSGDTAVARLDVLLGKGPFSPPASGLVRIGENMTLAVSVSGDPGFDVQVRDCRAKDASGVNEIALTDENGCILKPKLFGAFQKTRETGDTGASIIAYAYFQAFKFPDIMDLTIECNVDLCKTDCPICTAPGQQLEPGRRRRRRDVNNANGTLEYDLMDGGVMMGRHFRVVLAEDLGRIEEKVREEVISTGDRQSICVSSESFLFGSTILVALVALSAVFTAHLWLKNQRAVQQLAKL